MEEGDSLSGNRQAAGGGATTDHGDVGMPLTARLDADGRFHFDPAAQLPPPFLSAASRLTVADADTLRAAAALGVPWRHRFESGGSPSPRWFEIRVAPEAAGDGAVRCVGFLYDVTEDLRIQHRLERLNLLFRTLSHVNKTIPRALSEPGLLDDICRIVTENENFPLAWIGLLDEHQVLRSVARAGRADGYVDDLVLSSDAAIPQGSGPAGLSLRTGSHVVTNDFLSSPLTEPWRAKAAHWGIAASVALPLLRCGAVVGVFSVYSDTRDYFDEPVLALLDDLAVDISFGLQSLDHAQRLARTADELRASIERLHAVESATAAGSFDLTMPGWAFWWSGGAAAVLGLPATLPPSREALMQATLPQIEPVLTAAISEARERGAQIDIDIPVQRGLNNPRWVRIYGVVAGVEKGVVKIAGTVQDITDRKRLEADLLVAADGERKRLAAEIHDDLGQILTGASLMVGAAVKEAAAGSSTLSAPLQAIKAALAQATAACRNIAHGASATWVGPLLPALNRLVELTNSERVRCELDAVGNLDQSLSDLQQADLYRIAQEAVTNALKHARCAHIKIFLKRQIGFIEMEVSDDGVGLRRTASSGGLGLSTMKYRAVRAGGTFAVLTRAGGGTVVRLLIPADSRWRRIGV